ncbi:hypothetical protein OJ918_10285 [Streptococcus anginosus]|uniref:hypothetical protein n=1 Tax=Streptococcus anginosus TaxID=1328 RepID=UPI0021F91162|nr:hypothetical protein [Streptococcus anginosus]MCW1000287.1 hypothetical protein [Streptococcus anginosus]
MANEKLVLDGKFNKNVDEMVKLWDANYSNFNEKEVTNMAEDVSKLTDEEVGAIIQARYNAESLQPETEEDRKSVEERWKKINKMSCERLKKQGYNVELSSDGLKIKIIEKTNH